MRTHPTTPFGRRPLSLAMVAAQAATRDFAAKPDASETVVHKWRLFRALTEAKEPIGVTDRALSVLHALLSFHQETALTLPERDPKSESEDNSAGAGVVVFPSNRELSIRAHGMAPATLRRHLASLVEAGLIIRRDSPNGKRFARRGQGGEIESAFGFDLTPLIARVAEIHKLLKTHVKQQKRRANESQSERHIQNQITNIPDLEPSLREAVPIRPVNAEGAGSRKGREGTPEIEASSSGIGKPNRRRREPIRSAWRCKPAPPLSIRQERRDFLLRVLGSMMLASADLTSHRRAPTF